MRINCIEKTTEMILNLRRLDDYDRLTDWIRPLARGLAIYSFDRQLKTQPSPCETGIVVIVHDPKGSALCLQP
jgi:hypothetical protein